MLYIESFVEKFKREHLDRQSASAELFDTVRKLLAGKEKVVYEDDTWVIELRDEQLDSDSDPRTIVLPGGEWINKFYHYNLRYKQVPITEGSDIHFLLSVYILEAATVARDFTKGAFVGYPDELSLEGVDSETRQLTTDEIVAFSNDISRLENLLRKSQ